MLGKIKTIIIIFEKKFAPHWLAPSCLPYTKRKTYFLKPKNF
jgi:hypothetical protein